MRNLLTYFNEMGSVPFKEREFNEVDSLILCQLAYLNFEKVVENVEKKVALKDVFVEKNFSLLNEMTFSPKQNIKLMKLIRDSRRFRNIKISHIENHLSYDDVKQFYALTFHFPNFKYICFRGTDLTILGWKENFNMSYMKEIPSQKLAYEYINKIYNNYKCPMYVGGHSKGGNLAIYAAIKSNNDVKDNIIAIYNFDGPGFNSELLYCDDYLKIRDKIIIMTAKEAIIAMLLYHVEDITFIKTKGVSILQHIPYNWCVADNRLKRIKKNTPSSRWFARTIRHFYEDTNEYERKRFVDLLFTIVEVSPDNSVEILKKRPFKFLGRVNKKYRGLSKDDKKFMKYILKKYRHSSYHVVKIKIKSLFSK